MVKRSASARHESKAFTLIELLVVVAIIALLVSILLPSLGRARELARRTICTSNTRGITQAFIGYSQENRDWFPAVERQGRNRVPVWTFENIYLEWLLSNYLSPAFADPYNSGAGAPFVAGGQWMCPSAPGDVLENEDGNAYYDWSQVTDMGYTQYTNAYTGLYYHWYASPAGYGGQTSAQIDRSWTLGYFTMPSGAPVQFCSNARIMAGYDLGGTSWHFPDGRPTGFLDGHSAVLMKDYYQGTHIDSDLSLGAGAFPVWEARNDGTYGTQCIIQSFQPIHAVPGPGNDGDYALSEK